MLPAASINASVMNSSVTINISPPTANSQLPPEAGNAVKLWCLVPMCQVTLPGAGRIENVDREVTAEEKRRYYLQVVVANKDPSKIFFPPPSLDQYAKLPNDVILVPGCIKAPTPMRTGLAKCVATVKPMDGRVHLVADPITNSTNNHDGFDLDFQTSGIDQMPEVQMPDKGPVRMMPSWSGNNATNGVSVPLVVAYVP